MSWKEINDPRPIGLCVIIGPQPRLKETTHPKHMVHNTKKFTVEDFLLPPDKDYFFVSYQDVRKEPKKVWLKLHGGEEYIFRNVSFAAELTGFTELQIRTSIKTGGTYRGVKFKYYTEEVEG